MITIMGLFVGNPLSAISFFASAFDGSLSYFALFFTAVGAFIAYLCFYPFAPNDNPNSRYTFQQKMIKNDPTMKLILYPFAFGSLIDGLALLLLWLLTS